jgi:protein ImuA
MQFSKAEAFARLQAELLQLQGFRPPALQQRNPGIPGPLHQAFPHQVFPGAGLHEFISHTPQQLAATYGFVAALAAALRSATKPLLWFCRQQHLFAPALQNFQLPPDQVIFIHCPREADLLWCLEEALKCKELGTVVAELSELDFTTSRRLQLAIEHSAATALLLRHQPQNMATASLSRWQVSPAASARSALPGWQAPCWQVLLSRVRNGRPGHWLLHCPQGRLQLLQTLALPLFQPAVLSGQQPAHRRMATPAS